MQSINPYQISSQDAQHIQYVVQPQYGQQVKVLTSAVIPQQQNYEGSILNQTQVQSFDNSFNYAGQKTPFLVQSNAQQAPQQVLQYSMQPIVNQQQKHQIQVNGQQVYPQKGQTDRLNDTNDDRFRFSNISSISNNNSMISHSRKVSDRIPAPYTPTIASQIVQPGASQVINPLSTYNQQLQIHQQQQEKLKDIQNKTINQTFSTNVYNSKEDNEQRLRVLIKENEQLIKENEYYKKALSGLPQQQQNIIALQQQIQQLANQTESVQSQLQVQRDEAAMWCNREKEMNERCKGIYEQLQMVKNQDNVQLASQNQQLQQRIIQLEQDNQAQQRQINELNATLKVYKDSMQNQGIISNQAQNRANLENNFSSQVNSYGISNNYAGQIDYSGKYQQSSSQKTEPQSNPGTSSEISNQYAYSSPKQREEMVQSIIKQYKLGGNTPSSNTANAQQFKKQDEYSYNTKVITSYTNGNSQNEGNQQQEAETGDWRTKYDNLSQKLNNLNYGGDSSTNKSIY
ncbi:hypothetical protein TTHERM_00394670 (macronuclear) [Tetrahymena thermophila SB210]|uniref:Uncharacterized protein n=1 Tax=Tetrahymena thermophila (strain SB210) TaxID=312017 RepID=Q232Y6_TETTS|nr:hypothetical protein TTHERM_00394670 [Tetrahymena thermophila SB210]EAR91694.1 hypothetical protein TTHERM_00394670 [Tetrahymena thermophila SB210]|eukprot:XP_001011939.1 hypothetical protein TTHERM_00394670 [Tetrahymena thermophila SB210]